MLNSSPRTAPASGAAVHRPHPGIRLSRCGSCHPQCRSHSRPPPRGLHLRQTRPGEPCPHRTRPAQSGRITVPYPLQSVDNGTTSARDPVSRNARYQSRMSCQWLSWPLGSVRLRVAHSASAENRIAVGASTGRVPCTPESDRRFSIAPRSTYLAEHRRIWARVRHHSGVERLRTGARLSSTGKKLTASAPIAHMGQSVADHLAVAFARVDRLPTVRRTWNAPSDTTGCGRRTR